MRRRVTLPGLERLKRQIESLEWLLGESGFSPKEWDVRVVATRDEGQLALNLEMARKNRTITVGADRDPAREFFAGERHFWIDGNHWYDRFAVGTLRESLAPAREREDECPDE